MNTGNFYVYALKDPRSNPATPFYIGKGTGPRAWAHILKPDQSRKGQTIKEITSEGHSVITAVLVENLGETEALKLEAELISAFGTKSTGGLLTNSVIPSGKTTAPSQDLVLPSGSLEKAQIALDLLCGTVLELARANPDGISNADVARSLGLQSDYQGGSINYLSYSLLGLLLADGRIQKRGTKHFATGR